MGGRAEGPDSWAESCSRSRWASAVGEVEASESRLSGMGAEGLDQADSEQMDVAEKAPG